MLTKTDQFSIFSLQICNKIIIEDAIKPHTGQTFSIFLTRIRDVTEFELECCQMTTIFCKSDGFSDSLWIRIQLSFWKDFFHHSLQSTISQAKINNYA